MGTIVSFDFRRPPPPVRMRRPKTDIVASMSDQALQALFHTVRNEDCSSDAVRRLNVDVAAEMKRRGVSPL